MRVWIVGDSAIRAYATDLAAELGADVVVDTSVENCIPEHVWTEQIHDLKVRRQSGIEWPVVAVLYLAQPEYDSEATVIQLRRRLPSVDGTRIVAVVALNATQETMDGFTHEPVIPIRVVRFGESLA